MDLITKLQAIGAKLVHGDLTGLDDLASIIADPQDNVPEFEADIAKAKAAVDAILALYGKLP